MKPRIFVSSTFYDLKYVREDLSNFIKEHNFESIMFEDGDIGYSPGKHLDLSCYDTMKSTDMVILIIGGNYGSIATEETDEFGEYISVTRKEFKTAVDNGIPIFVFVDSKVYSEYGVYEMNLEQIEKGNNVAFKVTKDINVFKFIKEILSLKIYSIIEFDKATQIKEFLNSQWADMFKRYLQSLKDDRQTKSLDHTMTDMKNLINKIDIMLNSVGKKVLSSDGSDDYEVTLQEQLLATYSDKISASFEFNDIENMEDESERKKVINNLLKCLIFISDNSLWNKIKNNDKNDNKQFFDVFEENSLDLQQVSTNFDEDLYDIVDFIKKSENIDKIEERLVMDKYFRRMIYN